MSRDIAYTPGGVSALQNVAAIQPYQIDPAGTGNLLAPWSSAQIAANVVQLGQANISAANFLALASGVTVANAVAGAAYNVFAWRLDFTAGGANFTGTGNVTLNEGSAQFGGNIANSVIVSGSNSITSVGVGSVQTLTANTALTLKAASNFAAGNGTAVLSFWYSLL